MELKVERVARGIVAMQHTPEDINARSCFMNLGGAQVAPQQRRCRRVHGSKHHATYQAQKQCAVPLRNPGTSLPFRSRAGSPGNDRTRRHQPLLRQIGFGLQAPNPGPVGQGAIRSRFKTWVTPVVQHMGNMPNEVWTVDFKGWWYDRQNQRCQPLTVRDEHCRYVLEIRA